MSILEAIFREIARQGSVPNPQQPAAPPPRAVPRQPSPSASAPTLLRGTDIEAVLTRLDGQQRQRLDWRNSIVDLLKLLNLDYSLRARQQLARELGYQENLNDSASMNIWLHRKVMDELAASGGQVPDSLRNR